MKNNKNRFVYAKESDLFGKYLGDTDIPNVSLMDCFNHSEEDNLLISKDDLYFLDFFGEDEKIKIYEKEVLILDKMIIIVKSLNHKEKMVNIKIKDKKIENNLSISAYEYAKHRDNAKMIFNAYSINERNLYIFYETYCDFLIRDGEKRNIDIFQFQLCIQEKYM